MNVDVADKFAWNYLDADGMHASVLVLVTVIGTGTAVTDVEVAMTVIQYN